MGQDSQIFVGNKKVPQKYTNIKLGYSNYVQGIYLGRKHIWSSSMWKIISSDMPADNTHKYSQFSIPGWVEQMVIVLIGGGAAGYKGDGGLGKSGHAGGAGQLAYMITNRFPANSANNKTVRFSVGSGGFIREGTTYKAGSTSIAFVDSEIYMTGVEAPGGKWYDEFVLGESARKADDYYLHTFPDDPDLPEILRGYRFDTSSIFRVSKDQAPGRGGDGGTGGSFGRYTEGNPGNPGAYIVWGLAGDYVK